MFGFLNVYKPVGLTSHDVVAYFRKLLKIKQIGHTGTLDPFAEGVLPVCIGKATRLIEYLSEDKAYRAFVKFGMSTDTYDKDGKVIFKSDKNISKEELTDYLKNFKGEISQIPPMYSAIKVNGKKLYEYAREGKVVDIKPRKVTINKIDLESFDEENQTAQIYIECSRGTYIRSIADDLGKFSGCGAYLYRLIRTKSGKFEVENSIKLEDFKSAEVVAENIIPPQEMLNLQVYDLNTEEYENIMHGRSILNKCIKSDDFIILDYNNEMKAVAKTDKDLIKVCKVFDNV